MAEDKKGVIIYADYKKIFDKLTNDEAGKLIKHFFSYINDENPEMEDRLLDMAFEPIKLQLKRDLKKWEGIKQKRSDAGKAGGKKSSDLRKQNEANQANATFVKQNQANQAVTVNENVTVNVNESVMYSLAHCMFVALKDDVWAMNARATESELKIFNVFLLGSGVKEKQIADYKKHFNNWKRKAPPELKKPEEQKEKLTAPPLKRIA